MQTKRGTAVMIATLFALPPSVVRTQTVSLDGDDRRRFDLVSVSNDGAQGNNDSDRASISAGGRYVAFASIASNLVPGDANDASDVFVHDRRTDATERVSVGPLGVEGNGNSGMLGGLGSADISRDGRFVAFASEASNFVLGDGPSTADVFVHDRVTHITELVSRGVDGLPAGGSTGPSISGDGRFVAFRSFSDRLVPDGNPDFRDHVFVVDRLTRGIERIDVANDGTLADGGALNVHISADGGAVAFDSDAGNLVPGDGDQALDVFVRDRRRGRTEGVSNRRPTDTFSGQSLLSSISGDGRFVGFESNDPTLVPGGQDDFVNDAFLFDRERRRLRLVSRNSAGRPGNDDSFGSLVSDDGRFVVFSSRASNLVRGDDNQSVDVFRRDLEEGRTERLAADDISDDQPFGFEVVATDVTPRTGRVALLTRADLAPEQDVGSFVADVYVLDTRRR